MANKSPRNFFMHFCRSDRTRGLYKIVNASSALWAKVEGNKNEQLH